MIPVDKTTWLGPPPANYNFDIIHNKNICLAGTSVATGSGHAMTISTGDKTYMASIAKDLAKKRPLNTMQIGIRKVSYLLQISMAVMSPIVFIVQGGLRLRRDEISKAILKTTKKTTLKAFWNSQWTNYDGQWVDLSGTRKKWNSSYCHSSLV